MYIVYPKDQSGYYHWMGPSRPVSVGAHDVLSKWLWLCKSFGNNSVSLECVPSILPWSTPTTTGSPEYNAFCRLKHVLAEQLSNSFTSLKNDCLASALLTQEEMREKFGGHGVTPYQETSRLLDIVMMRIAYNPQLYHTFKNLSTLQRRAHKQLLEQLGEFIGLARKKATTPRVTGI